MGCITRECSNPECNLIDGLLPPQGSRHICPKCGGYMTVDFDEWPCHEEDYCEEEILSDKHWIER